MENAEAGSYLSLLVRVIAGVETQHGCGKPMMSVHIPRVECGRPDAHKTEATGYVLGPTLRPTPTTSVSGKPRDCRQVGVSSSAEVSGCGQAE